MSQAGKVTVTHYLTQTHADDGTINLQSVKQHKRPCILFDTSVSTVVIGRHLRLAGRVPHNFIFYCAAGRNSMQIPA
jgi:hypothetical protein